MDRIERPSLGLSHMRSEFAHHFPLLLITLSYCIVVMAFLASRGLLQIPLFTHYLIATVVPIAAVVATRLFGETAYHVLHVRPFLLTGLWQGVRQSELFSPERAIAAAIPILLLPIFSSTFTSFKVAIPQIAPFSWDPILMHYDMVLHGGVQPWEWLQPLLGHPFVTSAISYLYNIWHGMWLIVYWQIFRISGRALRMQFLLAYVLTWMVLGSIGAFFLSSAGPCYYGDVVDGPNPYAGLMTYLHQAHGEYQNWAILAQDYLWQLYQSGQSDLGGGISAMPSLHVAVSLLLFLLARHYDRRITWLAGVFVVVMLVGSVHLGWHYALDGYLGLMGAMLAWWGAGWLVRNVVPNAPDTASAR